MTSRAARLLGCMAVAMVVGPWLGVASASAGIVSTPSVAFTDTCAAIDVDFTAAEGGTDFVVSPPDGTAAQTVHVDTTATATYAVDAQHPTIAVSWAGNPTPVSHDWAQPSDCQPPAPDPVVDPAVSFSDDCVTGIGVVLTNIAVDDTTTAPVRFAVTTPSGTVRHVTVRADQIVRLLFPVAEDTTATVRVSAPGLSPQVHRYHKDCTHVLGEKVVHSPTPATPADPPQAAGSPTVVTGPQLPFTGLPTAPAIAVGAALVVAGALLSAAGRRPASR